MAVEYIGRNRKVTVLLNPAEKGRKFADEIKAKTKLTHRGQVKVDYKTGEIMELTKAERAYRAGYLDARKDSAKAYNANKKKQSKRW